MTIDSQEFRITEAGGWWARLASDDLLMIMAEKVMVEGSLD